LANKNVIMSVVIVVRVITGSKTESRLESCLKLRVTRMTTVTTLNSKKEHRRDPREMQHLAQSADVRASSVRNDARARRNRHARKTASIAPGRNPPWPAC